VSRCPHCGEELEAENDLRRRLRLGRWVRRDSLPHRGRLIAALGSFSMVAGGLSLCLLGFGAVVALPAGVAAWVMANRDLELMRSGEMARRTVPERGTLLANLRLNRCRNVVVKNCAVGVRDETWTDTYWEGNRTGLGTTEDGDAVGSGAGGDGVGAGGVRELAFHRRSPERR